MNQFFKRLTLSIPLATLLMGVPTYAQTKETPRALDRVCVSTAIEKRENTIIAAESTHHISWNNALTTRKTALLEAWKKEDNRARATAVRAAWEQFRKSKRDAKDTYHNNRNDAWRTFKTERKACGKDAVKNLDGGPGQDNI